MMNITEIRDSVAKELFNETPPEAWKKGTCIWCKQPAGPRCHTPRGIEEYQRSAVCEVCFDRLLEGD